MREVVLCLEELSARRFLEGFIPRINQHKIPIRYIVFEGKQDLEASLARRIRGYRNREALFIVLRDQDGAADCREIKRNLSDICIGAGRPDTIIRIACRELEAFYWGDMDSVGRALSITGLERFSRKAQFRDSDNIINPARELKAATKGVYQKVLGSELIGKQISIDHCTSKSFQALKQSLLKAVA